MLALLLTATLLHPVHETVSEVEWNETTKRMEVALRLDPLDEQWLMRSEGRKAFQKEWALEHLRRKFRIGHRRMADASAVAANKGGAADSQRAVAYHWIGRDDKGSHVWWYFELAPRDGKRPLWIDQRILLERNENHLNRILVLGEVPRRALTLTIRQSRANLYPAKDEQAHQPDPDSRSRLDRR